VRNSGIGTRRLLIRDNVRRGPAGGIFRTAARNIDGIDQLVAEGSNHSPDTSTPPARSRHLMLIDIVNAGWRRYICNLHRGRCGVQAAPEKPRVPMEAFHRRPPAQARHARRRCDAASRYMADIADSVRRRCRRSIQPLFPKYGENSWRGKGIWMRARMPRRASDREYIGVSPPLTSYRQHDLLGHGVAPPRLGSPRGYIRERSNDSHHGVTASGRRGRAGAQEQRVPSARHDAQAGERARAAAGARRRRVVRAIR